MALSCLKCNTFVDAATVIVSGVCPTCGRPLDDIPEPAADPKAPWHFKVLVGLVCVYLAWRVAQMIGWLF